ncbi:LysR family transcriptional regulator [Sphingobium sp. AEW010]|nr:LysR family transcriptional regulator [Sphingobium sp. AEW010]TWD18965.1 LysR family transcriptional regulator [Sphingobium sp. AEW013]TWD21836.1 LysR family transcriptional regulator [Sphingobium sp. AEW001]
MRLVELSGLELTHLRVLHTLFRERSVRQTAETLCLTPSAVSHALKRLWDTLGDELFLRTSEGMHPTVRARELEPKLADAMRSLGEVFQPAQYDPATSDRRFHIACLPFRAANLLPNLAARLRDDAPGIFIQVHPLDRSVVHDLETGRIDLVIGNFGTMPDWMEAFPLSSERLVVVLRKGHERGRDGIDLHTLGQLSHVDVRIGDFGPIDAGGNVAVDGLEFLIPDDRRTLTRLLDAHGLRRRVAMMVSDNMCALGVVARSDLVTLSIRQAAIDFSQTNPIALFEPPFEAQPFPISMVWNRKLRDDPGLCWLRDMISDISAQEKIRTAAYQAS